MRTRQRPVVDRAIWNCESLARLNAAFPASLHGTASTTTPCDGLPALTAVSTRQSSPLAALIPPVGSATNFWSHRLGEHSCSVTLSRLPGACCASEGVWHCSRACGERSWLIARISLFVCGQTASA